MVLPQKGQPQVVHIVEGGHSGGLRLGRGTAGGGLRQCEHGVSVGHQFQVAGQIVVQQGGDLVLGCGLLHGGVLPSGPQPRQEEPHAHQGAGQQERRKGNGRASWAASFQETVTVVPWPGVLAK